MTVPVGLGPMKRPALLGAAAVAYIVAAWSVAPGFYDGFTPPQPYNFVCPPAIAGGTSGKPASGHLVIKVIGGVSDSDVAYTDPDGQLVIVFLPGAFDVTGKTSVIVDITPVSPCPKPSNLTFVTNTYKISADAPLTKAASLDMLYSNLVTSPSFVYRSMSPNGPWTNIGAAAQAQVWTIDTKTDQLGYFAAGYPTNAVSTQTSGGSQALPILVAVVIIVVLIAGIPLAVLRRRQANTGPVDEEGGDEDEG